MKGDGMSQGSGYKSRKFWVAILGMAVLLILSFRQSVEIVKAIAPVVSVIIGVYIGGQAYADGQAEKHK